MRRILHLLRLPLAVAILLFLLLPSATSNSAQTSPQSLIPDTPVGKQLKDWLTVFAGGRQEEYRSFIARHYAKSLLDQDSAHDRADRQARLYMDARQFHVREIEKSAPEEIVAIAQASLTDLWFRLEIKTEKDPPNRIVGFSAQRIPPPAARAKKLTDRQLIAEMEQFMNKMAREDAFSGTLLVAKDGKPVLRRAYGFASKAHVVSNRIDTKLNIASVTKMFTAVAVFQLIEQGKLSLTDTVGKILPDYSNKLVAEKVTIHHLLSHSSGLGDYHGPMYICRKGALRQVRDYFPLFVDKPLSFEPGERMQYSNAGYVLLGAIVEKASGENYFDYVRQHIFNPAGMRDTDFYETDIDTPNLATGYTNFKDLGDDYFEFHLGQRRNTSQIFGPKGSSQGGAFSTADDLLRLSLAFRGNKLLSAKSVDLMTTSKFFFRKYAGRDIYYGYGVELENINGKRVVGHGGGDLGISSGIRWYPDSGNYSFAVLSNYDRGGIVANDKLQEMIIHTQK